MPELPEVEITRLKLNPIIGKTIVNFWTDMSSKLVTNLLTQELSNDIKDIKIGNITRTGKVLFIHLEHVYKPPKIMAFHQRMSGRFKISNMKTEPTKHTRLILTFTDSGQLHFIDPRKFGVVWYGTKQELLKEKYLRELGPDALGIPQELFIERVRKYKGMVKQVLLRQDTVAGIGNIIVDETLWASRIHPKTGMSDLTNDQLTTIYISLQEVLRKSIKAKGSTLRDWKHPDEESGKFVNYMKVYGKKGVPCIRCNTTIIRTVVGSRGTWICTTCQKI